MSSHPFKHFMTITKHRHGVIRNGFHMGIFWQALRHDLSKYSYEEFHDSAKYYLGTSSPVTEQRLHNNYCSTICLHHTGRNKHHWEYWVDFFKGNVIAKTMPYKYCIEFVCDMLSASKTYTGKGWTGKMCLDYFEARKSNFLCTEATRQFVGWCLAQYAESGWTNLHKKTTKPKYDEIVAKYPDVEVVLRMPEAVNLNSLQ